MFLKLVTLAQRLAQRAVLLAQAVDVQFLAEDELHLLQREGLQHVIAGAGLHGLDRRLDRAVRRHHHHGNRGVGALHGLQEFQAIHARQFQVGHDQIDLFLPQDVQAGFGIRRREDGVALLGQVQLQQTPHLGFVFNDQEGGHYFARDNMEKTALSLGKRVASAASRVRGDFAGKEQTPHPPSYLGHPLPWERAMSCVPGTAMAGRASPCHRGGKFLLPACKLRRPRPAAGRWLTSFPPRKSS